MREVGFGFLLAPAFHRAMRHAVGPRREVGIRTIFNILGPLTNPAGAQYQLIGVFDQRWVEPLAVALGRLGCLHGLVVHGEDGLDEVSLSGPTQVAEWGPQGVRTYNINPTDYGLPCRPLACPPGLKCPGIGRYHPVGLGLEPQVPTGTLYCSMPEQPSMPEMRPLH